MTDMLNTKVPDPKSPASKDEAPVLTPNSSFNIDIISHRPASKQSKFNPLSPSVIKHIRAPSSNFTTNKSKPLVRNQSSDFNIARNLGRGNSQQMKSQYLKKHILNINFEG